MLGFCGFWATFAVLFMVVSSIIESCFVELSLSGFFVFFINLFTRLFCLFCWRDWLDLCIFLAF